LKYRRTKPYSAPPFALAHHPQDRQVVTLPLPGYRQARNYCCGFATVLMVLRHFERNLCGQHLFEALGTARDGTGQSAIVRVLRSEGVRASIRYDADFECIASNIDAGKVLIGYLDDEEHWLAIYGYGRDPQRVFVADPEPGKECEHPWALYGHRLQGFAIVCSTTAGSGMGARVLPGQLSFDFGS
jgi:ABC-type bacteriocin/lantibiotic exporter with double-glycine peptidase domain